MSLVKLILCLTLLPLATLVVACGTSNQQSNTNNAIGTAPNKGISLAPPSPSPVNSSRSATPLLPNPTASPLSTPVISPQSTAPNNANNLSRSIAANLISKNANFSEIHKVNFSNGSASIDEPNTPQGRFYGAMNRLGYTDSRGYLTEKGKTEVNFSWRNEHLNLNNVPVGERGLVEVTGISEIQTRMGVFTQATFTWQWKPINDIGKAMNVGQEIYPGEAVFQKFDDGWRVREIRFPE
jgi:hypothetical protein